MRKAVAILAILALAVPFSTVADISADDLPAGTTWYLHADFERMRSTDAGGQLYAWFQDEVIVEINDEMSVDLNKELDRITAFSNDGSGIIAIAEGSLSEELQNRIMILANADDPVEEFEYRGRTYFRAGDPASSTRMDNGDEIAHSGFFTFDVPGKLLMASEEAQIRSLIDNDGRVAGAGAGKGAILVLSADKQFVQAGMRTADFADDDGDWDSNILRNTEQAAILVSDKDGMLAIVAKLVSTDPEMTQSLASIVNGVLALQAFSGDMEPELADVLRNTRVEADGTTLSVSTVIAPGIVVRTLSD